MKTPISIRFQMKIFNILDNFGKRVFISLLKLYKKAISPYLPGACRFQPTCSEYMLEAINEYGICKGLYLGVRRLLRCHPWGDSGFDPVPLNPDKKRIDKGSD